MNFSDSRDDNDFSFSDGPEIPYNFYNMLIVYWKTNQLSDTHIKYKRLIGEDNYTEIFKSELTKEHKVVIRNIKAGENYEIMAL